MADEYGLVPVYVKEFHEVFAENEDHKEFGPLLQNMRVVDANGESQMDEDQWEAASALSALIVHVTCRSCLHQQTFISRLHSRSGLASWLSVRYTGIPLVPCYCSADESKCALMGPRHMKQHS